MNIIALNTNIIYIYIYQVIIYFLRFSEKYEMIFNGNLRI